MNIKINQKLWILTIVAVLFNTVCVFASESFNNNLLKTELHKSAIGGVRVVLFTGKPYTDAVKVNKKSDTEYVILMPETSNSSIGKPSLKWVSDVINDVEIKTQPYQNNIKGYTKVTIKSAKPIEISTQVQTSVSGYRMSDKEYKELLSQATIKKQEPQVKPSVKDAKSDNKSASQKQPKVTVDKKASTNVVVSIKPKSLAKNEAPVSKPAQKQIVKKAAITPSAQVPSKIFKTTKTDKKIVKDKNSSTTVNVTPTSTPTDLSSIQKESSSEQNAESLVLTQASKPAEPINYTKDINTLSLLKQRAVTLISILKNNIYLALAAAVAIFIFLLLVARKMNKSISNSQKNFSAHLSEAPHSPVDFTQNISEDMSWKEKFQTCVDSSNNFNNNSDKAESFHEVIDEQGFVNDSPQESTSSSVISDLDGLFVSESNDASYQISENDFSTQSFTDSDTSQSLDDFVDTEDTAVKEVSVDDLFAEDDELLNDEDTGETFADINELEQLESSISVDEPTQDADNIDSDAQMVKSEFIIDESKALYLVDFEQGTSLVGCIGDDVFVLKQFDSEISGIIKARLSEQSSNSSQYMVKVAGFRGIIEVSSDSMNLLIEL